MKIGFPNNPRKNIYKEVEWIGKNKFDFVDLFLEEDKAAAERIDVKKLKKLLKKYKLGTVGHTAWYLPIGSPVKLLRDAAVSEGKRYFEIFSKLGVKYVTFHGNWPPGMFSVEEGINFQVETLKRLVAEAKKYNLRIIYEPIGAGQESIESISKIMSKVPGMYLHIDIGHVNIHGRKPEEFIKRFHKKLKHIHLHDNDGREDTHLPMGTGNINWENLVKLIKKYYDGTITLEIFSQDKDYVLLSKKKLKKLWNKR